MLDTSTTMCVCVFYWEPLRRQTSSENNTFANLVSGESKELQCKEKMHSNITGGKVHGLVPSYMPTNHTGTIHIYIYKLLHYSDWVYQHEVTSLWHLFNS